MQSLNPVQIDAACVGRLSMHRSDQPDWPSGPPCRFLFEDNDASFYSMAVTSVPWVGSDHTDWMRFDFTKVHKKADKRIKALILTSFSKDFNGRNPCPHGRASVTPPIDFCRQPVRWANGGREIGDESASIPCWFSDIYIHNELQASALSSRSTNTKIIDSTHALWCPTCAGRCWK